MEWAARVFGPDVVSTEVVPFDDHIGMIADMYKIRVSTTSGEKKYLMKTIEDKETSLAVGSAREGLVYDHFAMELQDLSPEVVYSFGDMTTGEKFVIVEELTNANSCMQFQHSHPLHKGEKLSAPANWMESAVQALATVQAGCWNQESLLKQDFLVRTNWLKGEDSSYNMVKEGVKMHWDACDKKSLGYSDEICEIMDAAWSKTSFDAFEEQSASHPFTFCHGDYHPGNIMWHENDVKIIDWEAAMVAPGIVDFCYLMFNTSVEYRRENWEQLLEVYIAELAAQGVEYSLEDAKRDYIYFSVARLTFWFSVIHYSGFYDRCIHPENGTAAEWYYAHLLSFVEDFDITPENVSPVFLQ
jgi:thiamine kinase-like enzyme